MHGYLDLHLDWMPGADGPEYRQVGGYARIKTLVDNIRKETNDHLIFCDNGDTFHGTRPVVASQGKCLIPILNSLRLDAMTAHWDFAYGPSHLKELASQLQFPILAINVYDKSNGELFFAPYKILEMGEISVAIIGIASNIVDKSMPPHFSEGIRFSSGRDELPQFIAEAKAKGADLIVVLSHLGLPQDIQLVKEVEGVNIVLSGHTHNRLFEPIEQNKTIIIQSGSHGAFVGRVDLEIANKNIIKFKHSLIEVSDSIKANPDVAELVQKALSPFQELTRVKVGNTEIDLNRNTSLEASMDTFLLTAVREASKTQIAFSNGWRWGVPLQAGPVTENDLYNIVPMDVPITILEMNGHEILELLEENLEKTFSADPWRQQGGYVKRCQGITAYIKIENPPGTRIQKLFIGSAEVALDTFYKVSYLTMQGVPEKYGRNRVDLAIDAHAAMKTLLQSKPYSAPQMAPSIIAV